MANGGCQPGDLVRHAADAFIAVDVEKRILSMNPSAEALTGYSEAEALGRTCREVLQSSLCGAACPFDRAFLEEKPVTCFDIRVVNRIGEPIPVCVNMSVLRNQRGEKIGLVESIRDIRHILTLIADRDAAVEESRKLASSLEAILECGNDGVVAVDRDRRITNFSRSAEALTGYHRSEVLGKLSNDVFQGEFCPLAATLANEQGFRNADLSLRAKDGGIVPVRLTSGVLRDPDGAVIGAVAVLHDQREVTRLKAELREVRGLDRLVGKSPRMLEVYGRLERVAPTDSTVLIYGESGTGKELVAQILHSRSARWDKPLVKVNCAALPESLLESELFGHVRGAFTGALFSRPGRFELADGGSIFLDEIGDLSPQLQVKLLRVLQEREFERVGSPKTTRVDVRIIAATNRDLPNLVEKGTFREDLYYRLNVVPIELPALREHPEDIPLLAESFLDRMAGKAGGHRKQATPETHRVLLDYHWPGNVRELENALEYAVVTSTDDWIRPGNLPPRMRVPAPVADRTLAGAISLTERDALKAALRGASSSEEAAQRLGISRATLWRKMKRSGVSMPVTSSEQSHQ